MCLAVKQFKELMATFKQDTQCRYKRNIDPCSYNHCCSGKAMCYIFWVGVCSFRYPAFNEHALYCHLWLVRFYNIFLHYLISGMIFAKKSMEHEVCVLIFTTTLVWNIFHYTKNWSRYDKEMYIGLQVKYPLFLSGFNETLIVDRFSKNIQISNLMKICPVGAELLHAEGRTDMTKLIVVFCDFVKGPKNCDGICICWCMLRSRMYRRL